MHALPAAEVEQNVRAPEIRVYEGCRATGAPDVGYTSRSLGPLLSTGVKELRDVSTLAWRSIGDRAIASSHSAGSALSG